MGLWFSAMRGEACDKRPRRGEGVELNMALRNTKAAGTPCPKGSQSKISLLFYLNSELKIILSGLNKITF